MYALPPVAPNKPPSKAPVATPIVAPSWLSSSLNCDPITPPIIIPGARFLPINFPAEYKPVFAAADPTTPPTGPAAAIPTSKPFLAPTVFNLDISKACFIAL